MNVTLTQQEKIVEPIWYSQMSGADMVTHKRGGGDGLFFHIHYFILFYLILKRHINFSSLDLSFWYMALWLSDNAWGRGWRTLWMGD